MKIINEALLNETTGRAKQSPRLRMNYNFHEHLDDPVNRLLNALEPGTYLRPHRHLNPKKDEIFLLLRGRIAVFLFDNKGEITQTQILDPKEGVYGAEIKAGTWHGLLVLESGSVIYEIKEGPFAPLAPENFAPWSPAPEDTKGVAKYMELLGKAIYIIRKTKCFDFWERNVLFPKTKRSFFRTPTPLPCPFPLNFSLLIITKKFGNFAKNRYICIV